MFGYGFRFRSMLKTSFIKKKDELKATVAKKKKRVLISILMPLFAAGSTKDCQDAPVKRPAPLFEHFDTECGLGSMVTIRDVGRNPFITLSACESPIPRVTRRRPNANISGRLPYSSCRLPTITDRTRIRETFRVVCHRVQEVRAFHCPTILCRVCKGPGSFRPRLAQLLGCW